MSRSADFGYALVSGSLAGFSVDIVLYPLDTIKTRLQSSAGFRHSGGFRGIYRGLGSVAVGSVPGAALFFTTYESVKGAMGRVGVSSQFNIASLVVASCCGETMACLVRVPTEVVKQRTMTTQHVSSFDVFLRTVRTEGVGGLYRGFLVTLSRELPFALLQFPLWEYLKMKWSLIQQSPVQPWQSSVCGAFAGGFSAAITTPLDVAKTRIMLAPATSALASGSIFLALSTVFRQKGLQGLFAGVVPRTLWIALGGSIFLGVYDAAQLLLRTLFPR